MLLTSKTRDVSKDEEGLTGVGRGKLKMDRDEGESDVSLDR